MRRWFSDPDVMFGICFVAILEGMASGVRGGCEFFMLLVVLFVVFHSIQEGGRKNR